MKKVISLIFALLIGSTVQAHFWPETPAEFNQIIQKISEEELDSALAFAADKVRFFGVRGGVLKKKGAPPLDNTELERKESVEQYLEWASVSHFLPIRISNLRLPTIAYNPTCTDLLPFRDAEETPRPFFSHSGKKGPELFHATTRMHRWKRPHEAQ